MVDNATHHEMQIGDASKEERRDVTCRENGENFASGTPQSVATDRGRTRTSTRCVIQ